MRTITLEEHASTPAYLQAVDARNQRGFTNAYMHGVRAKLVDLGAGRLADMDAAGIDVQVLSLADGGMDRLDSPTASALARDVNDTLAAAVQAHRTRFAAFATVNLQDPESAASESERSIGQLGFAGVMVNGATRGFFLDHPRFTPFWEAIHALGVPVYLHPAPPPEPVWQAYFGDLAPDIAFTLSTAGWGWHTETGMHALRLMASGLFDRLPGLQIIIGHMGENLPFSLARAEAVFARVPRLQDRSIAQIFHRHFHITTSGYFTLPPFECALQVVGADRILFSVDYPFSSTAEGRRFLDLLPLNPADMEKIAHGNAERLLRLPSAAC